jgi:hypothetical protein
MDEDVRDLTRDCNHEDVRNLSGDCDHVDIKDLNGDCDGGRGTKSHIHFLLDDTEIYK